MKVGVLMPIGPQDPTGVVPGWAAMREAALATEEAGLDSVWVYDHLLFRLGTDGHEPEFGASRELRSPRPIGDFEREQVGPWQFLVQISR